ncbi:response regulator [Paraglaciecola aestuariivivens]
MLQKTARILLVEDDEDDFIIARDCLEELDEYQFTIDWSTTPDAALAQLKLNQHDICLLDNQLGALTGLSVLEKAKEIYSRVPIIMLTGQSDRVLDKAALDAGAVDFIVKSELDSPRFARAIRYALARQEVEKERLERINVETQSRSKDRFLAHLSHELRTPLTSILGYTELLLDSEKAKPLSRELNIILNNGKHLLSLLNDVLDLSKIAANKLELINQRIELNSFLVDLYTLMQVKADDKGLVLSLQSTTPLPQYIDTDPTRLRQILINLIYNALKFTEKGKVSVSVSAQTQGQTCRLSFAVTDTGQGIPAAKVAKIFQPFEQVEEMISRKEEGAGLGLAISSELAKKLGGEIKVESKVGQGSCFTLGITCQQINTQAPTHLSLTQTAMQNTKTALKPLTGKILVVDDLADIRLLVGHFLRGFGLTVDFAENGKQALEKVKQQLNFATQYHALIMDIHMPEMNGKQAVVALRELGFHQPILALTAANMKGVKEDLQALGFDQVIAKPVEKNQLYQNLANALKLDKQQHSIQTNAQIQRPNFLLVEDDQDAAEITKLMLENLGAEVTLANSGAECRNQINSQQQWHKVLLDLHLPDANGWTLAEFISTHSPNTQVHIVSGEQVAQSELEKHSCQSALLKPLNKEKLLSLFN